MTSQHTHDIPPREAGAQSKPARRRGHGWMMIACCIPMIVVIVALWLAGVIPASFLLAGFACVAMMALMMVGMGHGETGRTDEKARR